MTLFGKEREAPRCKFPEIDFSSSDGIALGLIALRRHAEDWAHYFIRYYETRANTRMRIAGALRCAAILFLLVGAALAAGRLLPPDWQKQIVKAVIPTLTPQPETVPAELGLVLFGVAAGLLLADRFGNISANWLRYRATAMVLERRLLEFRLAWTESLLALEGVGDVFEPAPSSVPGAEGTPSAERKSNAVNQMNAVRAFFAAMFDLVDNEAREWATAFQKSRGDFESYLKVAQETGIQRNERPKAPRPR